MERYTDVYFSKTRRCIDQDAEVTYGVFLRHDSICAIDRALEFLERWAMSSPGLHVQRHFHEGDLVPAESPLFSFTARLRDYVEVETQLLQRVGISCISAHNAYTMVRVCPEIQFIDMHARHAAGTDMVMAAAYGASVGSRTAKQSGAKGFVGSSLDVTAPFYGMRSGIGTMPHVLIGYAGSTLRAVQSFVENNPDDEFVVALVDYYGQEYTDALEVANWFKETQRGTGRSLGVRLDTHGGRFAEGLDYEASIDVVSDWMHVRGKWPIVRAVMGDEAFDVTNDSIRDGVAKILFGTGVSVANVISMRNTLDGCHHKGVKIVASSGFDIRKCRVTAKARAPIDVIGTGSFLPETLAETYATCDVYAYNGKFSVKVGREGIFRNVFKEKLS